METIPNADLHPTNVRDNKKIESERVKLVLISLILVAILILIVGSLVFAIKFFSIMDDDTDTSDQTRSGVEVSRIELPEDCTGEITTYTNSYYPEFSVVYDSCDITVTEDQDITFGENTPVNTELEFVSSDNITWDFNLQAIGVYTLDGIAECGTEPAVQVFDDVVRILTDDNEFHYLDNSYVKGGEFDDDFNTLLNQSESISLAQEITYCRSVGPDFRTTSSLTAEDSEITELVAFSDAPLNVLMSIKITLPDLEEATILKADSLVESSTW